MSSNSGNSETTLMATSQTSSPPATPTLLPSPLARAVSLVARSSSLYLRLGSFVGGLALDGARVTTLTGLEVSRAVLETILSRAGQDVAHISTGDMGKAEAEGLIEKSLAALHQSMTTISFAVSAGFHFSTATLASASEFSQVLLTTLDSILGSTDSSRAIASIITLIRHEFQNPATGVEGERVGVLDLVLGICGLALLQRWSSRFTDIEEKDKEYEEVVWDIVILDDGRKADVIAAVKDHYQAMEVVHGVASSQKAAMSRTASFVTALGDEEVLQAIQRRGSLQSHTDWQEEALREKLLRQLPPDTTVSITTATTTKKIITVEITGTDHVDILPPPGLETVEDGSPRKRRNSVGLLLSGDHAEGTSGPRYRTAYQSVQTDLRGDTFKTGYFNPETARKANVVDVTDIEPDSRPKILPASRKPNFTTSAPSSPDEPISPNTSTRPNANSGSSGSRTVSANQKKHRKPVTSPTSGSESSSKPSQKKIRTTAKKPLERSDSVDKKLSTAGIRNAIKKGTTTSLSTILGKDASSKGQEKLQEASQSELNRPPPLRRSLTGPASMPRAPVIPRSAQKGNPNHFSSKDLGRSGIGSRRPSEGSLIALPDRARDKDIPQSDGQVVRLIDRGSPVSPTASRSNPQDTAHTNLMRTKSEKTFTLAPVPSPPRHHRRTRSFVPSIYTLNTNTSNTSLVLSAPPQNPFWDQDTLRFLSRTGQVEGMFPNFHIVRNISRFVRFASASYGSHFMRLMGLSSSAEGNIEPTPTHHYEHHSFSHHTQLPADTILLSSFVDPQGGADSTGHTNTGIPMVHFVSIDHESKAVVLTCRGTLGFEDVLTDLTCEYDELFWRGKSYKVHKGIHASARRLLHGGGGRVMATIRAALEEFSDYGLVLCGHSLGGGVTALLAVMISQPADDGVSFRTSATPPLLLGAGVKDNGSPLITLPAGRSIHVYAYGPPATMSPSLRTATRGLITTIVNGQDVVPFLSLGVLHDLQAVALALKTDTSGAKGEVTNRLFSGLMSGFTDQWYGRPAAQVEDDEWAYASLKTLRASMLSAKLLPPGEVFVVETQPVLQRQALTTETLGRPARRVVLKYIRKAEARFGELRFGGSMLLDHSPGRYEASLAALSNGVLE